jgi:hypothetical protein
MISNSNEKGQKRANLDTRTNALVEKFFKEATDPAVLGKMIQDGADYGATTNHINRVDSSISNETSDLLNPVDVYLLSQCGDHWEYDVSSSQQSYRHCVAPFLKKFSDLYFNAIAYEVSRLNGEDEAGFFARHIAQGLELRADLYSQSINNPLLDSALLFIDPLYYGLFGSSHYDSSELVCR